MLKINLKPMKKTKFGSFRFVLLVEKCSLMVHVLSGFYFKKNFKNIQQTYHWIITRTYKMR